jgi:enoyl-CoA hydratase
MSQIILNIVDGVAEVCLDNPSKLNALTVEMLTGLEAACDTIEGDRRVRSVLLTATGERAFCVGADISAWGTLSPADFARLWVRRGHRVFDRVARLAVPTIAVISGPAFGGGLELAAACDLRVISPESRLGLPETGIGIVPGWSGTQRLARMIPPAILKEMVLLGRHLDAERAFHLGLVNAISNVPITEARAMAAEIASKAPHATEVAKYQVNAALGEDRDAMIEALGGAVIAGSDDKSEGVSAFMNKRKPNFGGSTS